MERAGSSPAGAIYFKEIDMSSRENMIRRMYHKAASDYDAAKGSLDLLLDHPAGIGDHSTDDLYKSFDEALNLLVDANDRLEMLASEYPENMPNPCIPTPLSNTP